MSSTAATVANLILPQSGYPAGQGVPADVLATGGFDNQLQTARQSPTGAVAPTAAGGQAANPLAALLQQGANAALADGTGGGMPSTGTTISGANAGAAPTNGKPGNGASPVAAAATTAAAATALAASAAAALASATMPPTVVAAAAVADTPVAGVDTPPAKPSDKAKETGNDQAAAALAGAMLAALGQLTSAVLPASATPATGVAIGKAPPTTKAIGLAGTLPAATALVPGAVSLPAGMNQAAGVPAHGTPAGAGQGAVDWLAPLSTALAGTPTAAATIAAATAPPADAASSADGAGSGGQPGATALLDAQAPSLAGGGAAPAAGAAGASASTASAMTTAAGTPAAPAAAVAFVNLLHGVPVPALSKHAEPTGLAALLPPTVAGVATVVPMHALSLANPPGTPAFTQELSQQIAWLGGQAITQARIRLHPQDLGQLDVKVSVQQGGQVDLSFAVQHPAVVHALQQTLPQLNAMLAQHGLSLGQAQVGQQQAGREGAHYAALAGGAGGGSEDGEPIMAIASVAATTANGLLDTFA